MIGRQLYKGAGYRMPGHPFPLSLVCSPIRFLSPLFYFLCLVYPLLFCVDLFVVAFLSPLGILSGFLLSFCGGWLSSFGSFVPAFSSHVERGCASAPSVEGTLGPF